MKDKLKQNKIAPILEPPTDSKSLRPEPTGLFANNPIDLDVLRKLEGQSILSVRELEREQVIELCKLAAILENFEIAPFHVLDGKLAITAFFEASTRTRLSFETAFQRLDGKILSIPEGGVTGVKKGESLEDIGEMFNAYGDLVIMRHVDTDSLDRLSSRLRIPLVNAGNGSGEHPTQALADWYALLKWNPNLAVAINKQDDRPLQLGILGTPGSMRAVKSFLLMSLMFAKKIERVIIVSEMADPYGADLADDVKAGGIDFTVTNDVQDVLPNLDIIYMNSIAFLGDSYRALDSRYKLHAESRLKENAVILHPLARLDELSTSLDDTSHNLYFSQAHGAVFIRQALLISVLGRLDRLPKEIPTTINS